MEQTPLQEQVQTSSSPPPQQLQTKPSVTARNVISVSAAVLGVSFFMPWMMFFGANISGLDIQKNFPSYKLVWFLPACAAYVLIMNMAGKSKASDRRIAGAVPFAILAYSLNKFGTDLFQALSWGGWVALAAGFVLIAAPSPSKSKPKA
jgi:hypothetical protein